MWITAADVMVILEICRAQAYKVINALQDEMRGSGFYVNPNRKVPIKYFCERYRLDENEVKKLLKDRSREVKV